MALSKPSVAGYFDIEKWAKDNNLSQGTLQSLLNQGFDSIKTLAVLTSEDAMQTFRKEERLPLAQVCLLKEAVMQLQGDRESMSEGAGCDRSTVSSRSKTVGADVNTHTETRQKSEALLQALELFTELKFVQVPGSIKTLRFLLMGKTGVGKSTTGNTILGGRKFKASSSFSSMTRVCDLQRGVFDNVPIEIIDCPGLYDTKVSETEITEITVKAVACMHPGPDGFIFVIKAGRFTEEEEGTFIRLINIFDKNITEHMIIIFTGGDDLKSNEETIEENLRNAPEALKSIVRACGGRYVVFDNNSPEKKPQVMKFLEMAYKMVNKNNYYCYKCPKYSSVGSKVEEELIKVFANLLQKKKITQEEKDRLYAEELNQLKDRIAKNEEQGLVDVMVNTVKSAVTAPIRFIDWLRGK